MGILQFSQQPNKDKCCVMLHCRQEMQEWQSMQCTQELWRQGSSEITKALSQARIHHSFTILEKKKNGREEKRRRVKTNDMFMNMCCRFSVFHSIKATKIDLSGNVVIHITLYDEWVMKLRIKIDMKEGSLGFKLKLRGGGCWCFCGWMGAGSINDMLRRT